ncbi:phage integrase family protein [Roseateles toxinivorans]|uniref:Phage integrase family protein n=2 Tax=Roseateles toxinivorans TaxID=270368 RepID=A0A4R6QPE6_9BURK|nr:phage integrase family protein [Roseateles toxinivorans]
MRLRAVSVASSKPDAARAIVAFVAGRERNAILSSWAEESDIAFQLQCLGGAVWADAGSMTELEPVSAALVVSTAWWGSLEDHYLAAMTAGRRALPDDRVSTWLEKLRVFLVVSAFESQGAGVVGEKHLQTLCRRIRQICDSTNEPKRAWLEPLIAETVGFPDFIEATRRQCALALQKAEDPKEREFHRALIAVLDHDWRAISNWSSPQTSPHLEAFPRAQASEALPPTDATWEDDPPGMAGYVEQGGEAQTIANGEVDNTHSAPRQRKEGSGLILQALEETQYLRHSWHRLSHCEEAAFLQRLNELLCAKERHDRVGAALVAIAVLTSSSLNGVGRLAIRRGLCKDWAIHLPKGILRRLPPRFERRWQALADDRPSAAGWVRPMADDWRFELAAPVLAPLLEPGVKLAGDKQIKQIWSRVSPGKPLDNWFGETFAATDALARLTSPVTATMLAQHAFEESDDHALARLVGSSTRTGLPSACAYGSYRAPEVRGGLKSPLADGIAELMAPQADWAVNAAGSELDVDLERLRVQIKRLRRKVNDVAKDPARWVDHHNLLTSFCVLALLASTGGRPVTSPFESLAWIDLDGRRIYVEDKHSGPSRGARLCVLADLAADLLNEHYLPHLRRLSRSLEPFTPTFAAEITRVLSRNPESQIPMFFYLRATPSLDWFEVSETQLSLMCQIDWPLPWNVFRHLHSTLLRRKKLHPEIRDALLGHGDRGAESHGDFSWRVPADDLEAARPLVNELMVEFGFALPNQTLVPLSLSGVAANEPTTFASRPFGRQKRATLRERTHAAARQTARADIQIGLKGRPPATLSDVEWDKIAHSMLMRKNKTPHNMASLRYEVFEDYLSEIWRDNGIYKTTKRRTIPVQEATGPFSEEVIEAQSRLAHLREAFDQFSARLSARAPLPILAACLAAFDLALYSRVGNLQALVDLVRNAPTISVVLFQGRAWFEWSYRGDWYDGLPVYRVPITDRAARWIGHAQASEKRLKVLPHLPAGLEFLKPESTDDLGKSLARAVNLVAQANSLELPGAVAAILNNKRQCAALPHADWFRVTHLEAPISAANEPAAEASQDVEREQALFRHHPGGSIETAEEDSSLLRCTTLFKAIGKILSDDLMRIDKKAAEIAREVKASTFATGDAPFVLAEYVQHLLKRPKKSGPSGRLKSSTARRYWDSLAPGIRDAAADESLTSADDEELTEIYGAILDTTDHIGSSILPTGEPSPPAASNKPSDARSRTFKELVEFHEFARRRYGIEDPDWAEISPGDSVGSGRPGVILPQEYSVALQSLCSGGRPESLSDAVLASAFVLLVCARFGLRTKESVGLHRSDWIDAGGAVVVLVRSNATRGLKTIRSKRQVPLVGTFNSMEQSVVDETLRRWANREGVRRETPLVVGVGRVHFKQQKAAISRCLLPLLKRVTCNPAATVHHLRHSFATRLLALLVGKHQGKGIAFESTESEHARQLLLGSTRTSRRTLWAVARMLGHASPAMTLKAYLHGMEAWLPIPDDRAPLGPAPSRSAPIDLDARKRRDDYLSIQIEPEPEPDDQSSEPLLLRSMRYLRLRSIGQASEAASQQALLSDDEASQLVERIAEAGRRLTRAGGELSVMKIVSKVPIDRWDDLILLALKSPSVGQTVDCRDWLPTIGSSRQILLFLPHHFAWVGAFVRCFGFGAADIQLAHKKGLSSILSGCANDAGLTELMKERGGELQLDVAKFGPLRHEAPDRIAMLPLRSGLIRTSYELLLIWIVWINAQDKS